MSARTQIEASDANRLHAGHWLALAAAAVAVSGLFAILIALARVPAIGQLFPGAEFYRVALTLHVNLSQGVWFMSFAGCLWALGNRRPVDGMDRALLALAALGAIGIATSVGVGTPQPLMSNYLPVLDSPVFQSSLSVFGLALALHAARAAWPWPALRQAVIHDARSLGLRLAAAGFVLCLLLVLLARLRVPRELDGQPYFELLFWGGGHLWQFVLVLLLMVCWLDLAPARARLVDPRLACALFALAATPIVAGVALALLSSPDSALQHHAFTALMRWTSWPAPLLLLLALLRTRPASAALPGYRLSAVLFVQGLLLGTAIDGQTTLVTAHYHGTIGAVTLAFMAQSLASLPRLGAGAVGPGPIRTQLACYGYGIMLMMFGLAGAGLMGAPRKTPGELGLAWNVETVSRIMLGVGGLLATIGILMFAYLILNRLWPVAVGRRMQNEGAR